MSAQTQWKKSCCEPVGDNLVDMIRPPDNLTDDQLAKVNLTKHKFNLFLKSNYMIVMFSFRSIKLLRTCTRLGWTNICVLASIMRWWRKWTAVSRTRRQRQQPRQLQPQQHQRNQKKINRSHKTLYLEQCQLQVRLFWCQVCYCWYQHPLEYRRKELLLCMQKLFSAWWSLIKLLFTL